MNKKKSGIFFSYHKQYDFLKVFLLLGFNREIDEKTLKNHSNSFFFSFLRGKGVNYGKKYWNILTRCLFFWTKIQGRAFTIWPPTCAKCAACQIPWAFTSCIKTTKHGIMYMENPQKTAIHGSKMPIYITVPKLAREFYDTNDIQLAMKIRDRLNFRFRESFWAKMSDLVMCCEFYSIYTCTFISRKIVEYILSMKFLRTFST